MSDGGQREVADDDAGVPPLVERFEGILLRPAATFEALEPRWGWLGPWLAVMAAGLLAALTSSLCVDYKAIGHRRTDYALEQRAEQERRMKPVPQEDRDKAAKFEAYKTKIGNFAGPFIGTILRIVVLGIVLFAGAALLGGKRDLLRAIVVAAHAKLVAIVGYGAVALGAFAGNPEPVTSPANLANVVENPVGYALLDGLDPVALWHAVLVALGLIHALGVPKRRAVSLAAGIYVLLWALPLALAFASKGKS